MAGPTPARVLRDDRLIRDALSVRRERLLLGETCRVCGEPVSGDPTESGMCGSRRPAHRKTEAV